MNKLDYRDRKCTNELRILFGINILASFAVLNERVFNKIFFLIFSSITQSSNSSISS